LTFLGSGGDSSSSLLDVAPVVQGTNSMLPFNPRPSSLSEDDDELEELKDLLFALCSSIFKSMSMSKVLCFLSDPLLVSVSLELELLELELDEVFFTASLTSNSAMLVQTNMQTLKSGS
jgi:hypothetical protein